MEPTRKEKEMERFIRSQLGEISRCVQEILVLDMTEYGQESFYVEVLLNEGSEVERTRKILTSVVETLTVRGIKLDSKVGAEWVLRGVEHAGTCVDSKGQPLRVERFNAKLTSGSAQQIVTIIVPCGVIEEAEYYLGHKKPATCQESNALICKAITADVNRWLSYGGESRWDPVAVPIVEIGFLSLSRGAA